MLAAAASGGCGDEGSEGSSASQTTAADHRTTASAERSGGERSRPPPLELACTPVAAREASDELARVGFEPGAGLKPHPSGSANRSQCRLSGPGAEVEVTHDSAPAARRRYYIRITELAQFSATNRRLAPRPVSGIGARRLEGAGANWVPAQRRLLSIRGGTMQAVHVYARGVANRDLRTAAIELARRFERVP